MKAADDMDLADRLASCYSGVVYDMLRARGHTQCILPPQIVPLDRDMRAAGPVFTVRGQPDAKCLDVAGYRALLDSTIDRILEKQQTEGEP